MALLLIEVISQTFHLCGLDRKFWEFLTQGGVYFSRQCMVSSEQFVDVPFLCLLQLLRPIYKQIAENQNAEIFSANTLLVILGTSLLTARVWKCFQEIV